LVSNFKKECRWRVLENRVLKKMFESEREEVTGDWRTLCNEELHDLNSAPNVKMIKLRRPGGR
jgi:hypothetical protein